MMVFNKIVEGPEYIKDIQIDNLEYDKYRIWNMIFSSIVRLSGVFFSIEAMNITEFQSYATSSGYIMQFIPLPNYREKLSIYVFRCSFNLSWYTCKLLRRQLSQIYTRMPDSFMVH